MITVLWTRPNEIRSPIRRVLICYLVYVTPKILQHFHMNFILPPFFFLHHLLVLTGKPEPWFCSPPIQNPTHWANTEPKKAEAPTLPRPGASFTLLTALSRQGGAGGGEVCRMPLKLVAKRGGSTTEEVEGRCFFFLEDRFNFWAALERKMQKRDSEGRSMYHQRCSGLPYFLFLKEPPSSCRSLIVLSPPCVCSVAAPYRQGANLMSYRSFI